MRGENVGIPKKHRSLLFPDVGTLSPVLFEEKFIRGEAETDGRRRASRRRRRVHRTPDPSKAFEGWLLDLQDEKTKMCVSLPLIGCCGC